MNPEQRIRLHELVNANKSVDNTNLIRELKHSEMIWADVVTMQRLKTEISDLVRLEKEAQNQCGFIFSKYTMIMLKII
jgi:precorrin-2 methylase